MNYEEIKDIIEIVKNNKEVNIEQLLKDSHKRGFLSGMRYENKRILELINPIAESNVKK